MNPKMKININKNSSRNSSVNHSYVNLHPTDSVVHGSDRDSQVSYTRRSITSPRMEVPLKVRNRDMHSNNSFDLNANASLPRNRYSHEESVKSLSRSVSYVDQDELPFKSSSRIHSVVSRPLSTSSSIVPKSQLRLQTINEDNIVIPMDKLLELCTHPNEDIRANALGHLQHITFNNPEIKMQVRDYEGLPIIIEQILCDNNYVARPALGVLKNMSFTEFEMITTEIGKLGGIQTIIQIIILTDDITQKELALDILWNLSVKYNLKPLILRDVVPVLVKAVIIMDSGMLRQEDGNYVEGEEDIIYSTMLRNALGIIRNISYENVEARSALRESDGLIDCLLYIIFQAGNKEEDEEFVEQNKLALIDNKIIENCLCILRNLTYAIQEIVDPEYLEKRQNTYQGINKTSKKGSKENMVIIAPPPSSGVEKGVELLWNSKYIVTTLYPIMENCSNAVTLEAAAGVTQNLTAGDWEPSKEMQSQFRLQLALPKLLELIEFGTNEVIRSAATALRNLVQEEYCRILIGKNGLQQLVAKIPLNSNSKEIDPTALAALLSTIYVIILDQVDFMKDFVTNKGANRCLYIRDNEEYIMHDDHFPRKIKVFSQCILNLLWKTSSIQSLMKKVQIKPSDITSSNNQPSSAINTNIQYDMAAHGHDSMVSGQNESRYPRDQRYLRDSMAEIVSNKDLKERNSVAYTTNSVPGYGEVRIPSNNRKKSAGFGNLGTIKSESRLSSIVSARDSKMKSAAPSYQSRNSNGVYDSNDYRVQTPRSTTQIYTQPINGNININNRRSSNNPSHSSRIPKSNEDGRNGSRNGYRVQTPRSTTQIYTQPIKGNVNINNRRSSNNPSHSSRMPKSNEDGQNISYEYARQRKPVSIQSVISQR